MSTYLVQITKKQSGHVSASHPPSPFGHQDTVRAGSSPKAAFTVDAPVADGFEPLDGRNGDGDSLDGLGARSTIGLGGAMGKKEPGWGGGINYGVRLAASCLAVPDCRP